LTACGGGSSPTHAGLARRYGATANLNSSTAPPIWDACQVAPLVGNKAIEDAAIAWVMELERANGRQPQDTRYRGAPADIQSSPRLIEVKAYGTTARGSDLLMEVSQVEEARRNPDFYVYVVENVKQGDPAEFTLRALGGPQLQRLLERAKEYTGYRVPWPVADYVASSLGLDG
jgi:Domain of unknown function (DUF3883)